jgi:hypothetical protein
MLGREALTREHPTEFERGPRRHLLGASIKVKQDRDGR